MDTAEEFEYKSSTGYNAAYKHLSSIGAAFSYSSLGLTVWYDPNDHMNDGFLHDDVIGRLLDIQIKEMTVENEFGEEIWS